MQLNFELATAGQVIVDMAEAKAQFDRAVSVKLADISLQLMVDLFKEVNDHIIPSQNFFNKVIFHSLYSRSCLCPLTLFCSVFIVFS